MKILSIKITPFVWPFFAVIVHFQRASRATGGVSDRLPTHPTPPILKCRAAREFSMACRAPICLCSPRSTASVPATSCCRANGPTSAADKAAWAEFRWAAYAKSWKHAVDLVPWPDAKGKGAGSDALKALETARDLISALAVPQDRRNKMLLSPFFPSGQLPTTHPEFHVDSQSRESSIGKAFAASWPKLRSFAFCWAGLPCSEHGSAFSSATWTLSAVSIRDKLWPSTYLVLAQLNYPITLFKEPASLMASDSQFLDILSIAISKGNRTIARGRYLDNSKLNDSDLDRAGTELLACLSLLSSLLDCPESESWIVELEPNHPVFEGLEVAKKVDRILRKCGYKRYADMIARFYDQIEEIIGTDDFSYDEPTTTVDDNARSTKACSKCGLSGSEKALMKCGGEAVAFIDSRSSH